MRAPAYLFREQVDLQTTTTTFTGETLGTVVPARARTEETQRLTATPSGPKWLPATRVFLLPDTVVTIGDTCTIAGKPLTVRELKTHRDSTGRVSMIVIVAQ